MFFGYVNVSGADHKEANGVYWPVSEENGITFQQHKDTKGLQLHFSMKRNQWSIEKKNNLHTITYYRQHKDQGSQKIPSGERTWEKFKVSKCWLGHMMSTVGSVVIAKTAGESKLTFTVVDAGTSLRSRCQKEVGMRLLEIEKFLKEESAELVNYRQLLDSEKYKVDNEIIHKKKGTHGVIKTSLWDKKGYVTVELVDNKKTEQTKKKYRRKGDDNWRSVTVKKLQDWKCEDIELAPECHSRQEIVRMYEVLIQREAELANWQNCLDHHKSIFSHGEELKLKDLSYGPDQLEVYEIMEGGEKVKLKRLGTTLSHVSL